MHKNITNNSSNDDISEITNSSIGSNNNNNEVHYYKYRNQYSIIYCLFIVIYLYIILKCDMSYILFKITSNAHVYMHL